LRKIDAGRSVTNSLGRTIHVLGDDPRGDAVIASGGDFNPPSLAMWRLLVTSRPWDLVVDVGASYGEMLLGADLPPSAKIVAFEPDDAVRACLTASLEEAGMLVEVRGEAVSTVVGSVEFLVHPWSGRSHLAGVGAPAAGLKSITVPSTTLDAALLASNARTACIKIDVEGAEDLVLDGGGMFFRRLDEVAILIEVLHRDPADLVEWAQGWRMYLYDLRGCGLIRVGRGGADDIRHLLQQPWIYRQDAVLRRSTDR
jgi:FkbM family methyltransferase